MRGYLVTRLGWLISAGIAVLFGLGGSLIGVDGLWLLPVIFVGAVVGTLVARRLTRGLLPAARAQPPAPPGRGSGRRGR